MKIRPKIFELFMVGQTYGRKDIYFKPVDLFMKIFRLLWYNSRNTLISGVRLTNLEAIRLKTKGRNSRETYFQIKG